MAARSSSPKLDSIDLELIRELENDGRQTRLEIATALGISERTLRRRLQHLLDERVIRIQAIAGPLPLQSKMMAMLGINVLRGKINSVSDTLGSYKSVIGATIVAGRYDILASILCGQPDELWEFVTDELGKIQGVVGAEVMPVLRMFKNSYAVLAENYPLPELKACNWSADHFDVALIRELEQDGSQSYAALAQKLGLSKATILKRMNSLFENQVIRVVAVANPYTLGYGTSALILVKAPPSRVKTVAEELASFPETQIIAATAGPYDLTGWVVFKDTDSLSDFVRTELDNIAGITSHETLLNLQFGKLQTNLASKLVSVNDKSAEQPGLSVL
ncbi:MAG: Lrp/AsnC family transcriptional regulator [Dehalococcoidia bacterium]